MTSKISKNRDIRFDLADSESNCFYSIECSEGSSRKGTKEFIQFLWVANASLSEFETQLEIAFRLGYIEDTEKYIEKVKHIRKMLHGLIKSLEGK